MNPKKAWYAKAIRAGNGVECHYRNTGIPGTYCIEASWEHTPVPMATLWYRWIGKCVIDILDVYVNHNYRRLGLASRLLNEIVKEHKEIVTITTESATTLARPWLEHLNFAQNANGWSRVLIERAVKMKVSSRKRK